MNVTDIAIVVVIIYPIAFIMIYGLSRIAQRELKAEKKYREARELIKEMRATLLTISQTPIAYVCEGTRKRASVEWERTKEYAE